MPNSSLNDMVPIVHASLVGDAAADGDALEYPADRGFERRSIVQGCLVVPQHDVAPLPAVLVAARELEDVSMQPGDQRGSDLVGDADQLHLVRGVQVQDL